MTESKKAIFLSYASQDAEAARRICEALRAAGVEVWFDRSELRGGDAWDQKIRQQIKDCALFVPLISAHTEARPEGYFRLEWHLADQRTHLMAVPRPSWCRLLSMPRLTPARKFLSPSSAFSGRVCLLGRRLRRSASASSLFWPARTIRPSHRSVPARAPPSQRKSRPYLIAAVVVGLLVSRDVAPTPLAAHRTEAQRQCRCTTRVRTRQTPRLSNPSPCCRSPT